VLFDHERIGIEERRLLAGIDDSKQLDHERREELFARITAVASRVAVIAKSARTIDQRGLHICNLEALAAALDAVHRPGAVCLVDGFRLGDRGPSHSAVIGGDSRSAAIAAASIVAKVTRDRLMARAASIYPSWGFELNVGYSTPEHRSAILEHGICAIHRRSFQSIAYSQLGLMDQAA
jgi:ribonuclease HII